LLLFMGWGTVARSGAWRDDHRLAARMVETSPEARLPRQNLGLSFLRRGDYAQARVHLEEAVALGSASASLQATLGVVEASLGMKDEGLRRVLEAARREPGNPTLAALVADVHRVRGEPAEALVWLDAALRLNSGILEVRLNRAAVLLGLGRLDEAGDELERTRPALPAEGAARLTHARLEAELATLRDPRGSVSAWARFVALLRGLPERSLAQELDLAYAERRLAEVGRVP
jgi:tetratricopeptide (TPR) repeat protein